MNIFVAMPVLKNNKSHNQSSFGCLINIILPIGWFGVDIGDDNSLRKRFIQSRVKLFLTSLVRFTQSFRIPIIVPSASMKKSSAQQTTLVPLIRLQKVVFPLPLTPRRMIRLRCLICLSILFNFCFFLSNCFGFLFIRNMFSC